MNQRIDAGWPKRWVLGSILWLLLQSGFILSRAEPFEPSSAPATNICQLRNAITLEAGRVCNYDLTGLVLAADVNCRNIFFQDASGTAVLETGLQGASLRPGQRVRLCGTNFVAYSGSALSLGAHPLVDADNLHSSVKRFAEIHLKPGLHPIRVGWFNQSGTYFLNVAYAGPGIAAQTIPAAALFHNDDGIMRPGLLYRCFEGKWDELPDFQSLTPRTAGTVSTFDDAVKTRIENVGLEFSGFLQVPAEGNYTFYLTSDDGSQLFLDTSPPALNVIGTAAVPAPQPIAIGQPLPGAQESLWATAEGTVTFMGRCRDHVRFELTSVENRMQAEVLSASPEIPWYLLHCRVRVRGICPSMKNADGAKYAASILVADWRDVRVLEVAPEQWSNFRTASLGELRREGSPATSGLAVLHGRIRAGPMAGASRFEDGTGSAPVEVLSGLPNSADSPIDCLSRWSLDGTNLSLHEAAVREADGGLAAKTNGQFILKTAMQVLRLTREEAEREYPVEIQGTVTSVSDNFKSLLIQDYTRAVFVWVGDDPPPNYPSVGDYCKVEGISRPADFSPIVLLRKITILWKGQMPQPVIPTRDQLLSGSLDAQYIEMRGLVTAVNDSYVSLLTADGTFNLDISPAPGEGWDRYLNSTIRVRGCLLANFDSAHRTTFDQPFHLRSATVSIDSPPPTDLFAVERTRAGDLLQYDAGLDTFRRVKVRGQVVHCGSKLGYLMDAAAGVRFQLSQPAPFQPGDIVEVVGLVELGGASPVLRQAVARKVSHQPLPVPRQLSLNSLNNNYDATLVTVDGTLVDAQNNGEESVLDLQVGLKNFVARLPDRHNARSAWTIGSRLRLTGVFSALDGSALAGQDVNSFELLLNSPADVEILSLPPWWTLRRLMLAITCLVLGLALAGVWIALLRHQVERRTQQLGREISERERAEKLRAIEQERSRIARDLHDDLGSELTGISMIATTRPGVNIESATAVERLREIADKSRTMISALDGVVWLANSENDTLSSLLDYLASYAEEFLTTAQIAYRVILPKDVPERIIAAEIRHDVLLAVRESLNNAVRHGRPTEVWLRLSVSGDNLEIAVQDNGCGFDPAQVKGNGLGNLQQRMSKLNGSCQIQCSPGSGTTVALTLPLPK